jgi:hypothetical protein
MKIYLSDFDVPPYFDDLAQPPAPAVVVPTPRRLRNWHKFMLAYTPIMIGGSLILYSLAGTLTALSGLAIWLLTALIILAWARQKGRL